MRNWTNEQQQAIRDRGHNLLVTAAAGSGKTAVLVERIIQLIIKDKVDLDRMLIATFTQAAAGEMRERISSALLREMDETPEQADYLGGQMNLLNNAAISTLHAFCMDVVKRHFHLVGVDPRFRVGDATETGLMKLEALDELLEDEYGRGQADFLRLVEMFAGGKDDSPLQNLILRCHDFVQSQPQPLEWLKARTDEFGLQSQEFQNSPWVVSLSSQIKTELDGLQGIFARALDLSRQTGGPAAYEPALTRDIQTVTGLQTALQHDLGRFYEQLSLVQFTRLGAAGKETDARLREEAKGLRDQGKKLLNDIKSKIFFLSPEEFCRDLNELQAQMRCLYHLVDRLGEIYQLKKADKGLVDFNDLEHFALAILADAQVAAEYRTRFAYIFVDEYQDSNLVQETILDLIKREDNLFLVGDVKQSIYRFRMADPTLFLDKYYQYEQPGGRPQRRIDLSANFRSRAEIIDGINDIFRQIMSRECGEIDYDESVYLRCGALPPCNLNEDMAGPALELWLVDQQSDISELPEEAGVDEESEELTGIEVEAHIAAARIKELCGQSFYDSRLGMTRPLTYRDIVVLMRATRQQADVYYEILSSAGIPVYADVDRGYFQTLEISIFINLLKLIDNKRQDLPLLSVLRSPIGRFGIEDLIAIRTSSQAATFFAAMEEYVCSHDDPLQARLREFINQLDGWKEQARFTVMDEFIWQLLLETGYYYYVGAMPGGAQRQANLRVLLERARQFQATSLKGLFQFLKFVDKLQAGSGDMGMAKLLGENDDVVRIMSIHKSKGLEFPVVILAGLGRGFNLSDTRDPVLFHKELGIGPVYVNPEQRTTRETMARISIKNRIKLESLAEEMRILYVACTRPRDKLILLGSVKNLNRRVKKWSLPVSPFQIARGRNHLDWIGPLLMCHPDGEPLRNLAEADPVKELAMNPGYRWRLEILDKSYQSSQSKQSASNDWRRVLEYYRKASASPERDLIQQRLDWQYPFPEAVMIPSKISVSQVKDLQNRELGSTAMSTVAMIPAPRFLVRQEGGEAGSPSGADKGTLIHFVMQHLDFARVNSEAEIGLQLQGMAEAELLFGEEAQAVDTRCIFNYFLSPLGKRVLQASRVYREVPFNLVSKAGDVFSGLEGIDEELLLQGVIDLYFQEGDELVLVDYKTDRITPDNRGELIAKYRIQLGLYRKALEEIQRQRVKASFLYLFDSEEQVEVD